MDMNMMIKFELSEQKNR